MNRKLFHALVVALCAAAIGGLLSALGLLLPLAIAAATVVAMVAYGLPHLGVQALDALIDALRAWLWRDEQGRHHSFNGVLLDIHDDGRHVWIGVDGLQRVLGTSDSEPRLVARHPGRTRRDDKGALMIRVDTVVASLDSDSTGRDPRRLRLRRYLERNVLYPAAQRAQRR